MILCEFDTDKALKQISKALGDNGDKAAAVLASAATATAKECRKMLATKAQETYAVRNAGFNKVMKIQNASKRKPYAMITAQGKAMELINFKTNPAKVAEEPPEVVKAKVLKINSLKRLEKDGIKAFIVKFQSGHTTIAERKGQARLPIRTLYSHGVTRMLGDEKRVYGLIAPEVQQMLLDQAYKQIDKRLAKAAKEAS